MEIKIILCYIIIFVVMWACLRFIFTILGTLFSLTEKAPYVPSFNSHIRLMKRYLTLKKWARLVDLWCGDGKMLRFFTKEFGLICEGYDMNSFALRYGRILNRRKGIKNIIMIKSRFEKADLKKYDYIYMYLFPNQLIDSENRIFTTMKDTAIIISNSFKFANHKPFDTIKTEKGKDVIFLYKK